jgi:hypothetical protein
VKDESVMIIEVLIENADAGPGGGYGEATEGDLQDWADEYGLSMPVVSDPGGAYMWSHLAGGSVALPYQELLDQNAVVNKLGTAGVSDAESLAAD